MSKASDSIKKIQEAARQRVRQRLAKAGNSITSVAELPYTPIAQIVVSEKSNELQRKLHRKVDAILTASFGDLKKFAVASLSKDKNLDEVLLEQVVPAHCRFIVQGEQRGLMILEYPPTTRIINCSGYKGQNSLNIPFPYMYFIIGFIKNGKKLSIQGRGMGARTSPLKSKEDNIGVLPMPHTQGLTYICQTNANSRNQYDNLEVMANDLVTTFWRTQFVHNFMSFTVDKKKINSWEDWAQLTVLDMLKTKLGTGMSVARLSDGIRKASNHSDATRSLVQNLIGQAERKMRSNVGLFMNELNLKDELTEVLESVSSEIVDSK